jgi:menaquinone-specific isochorismate synthase
MPVPSQRGDARFGPDPLAAELRRRLERICLPGEGLVSVALSAPDLADVVLPPSLPELWSWLRPGDGMALIASGVAHEEVCDDSEALGAALDALVWRHHGPDGTQAEPVAFLGHGFGGPDPSGLPPALLRVPRLLLRRAPGRCVLIFSHAGRAAPETFRSFWAGEARRGLAALHRRERRPPQ